MEKEKKEKLLKEIEEDKLKREEEKRGWFFFILLNMKILYFVLVGFIINCGEEFCLCKWDLGC